MTEKNTRLQRWLENLHQITSTTLQKTRIKQRKARSKTRYPRFSTQMIRRDIVRRLTQIYEQALAFSLDESLDPIQREKWGRLAAYTAQTINTVLRAYDEIKIEKAIEELKEYVRKHVEGEG